MNVKDVMNSKTKLAMPTTSLREAAEKMSREGIGFLPVGEDDRLQGTVTDRDIVVRGVSAGKDPETTSVNDVFTNDLVYCWEDQDVQEAVKMMGEHKIRRLPVIDSDKRFVGVISLGDIAQHLDKDTTGQVLSDVTDWN